MQCFSRTFLSFSPQMRASIGGIRIYRFTEVGGDGIRSRRFLRKIPDLPWRCPPVQPSKIRSRLKAQLTRFTTELAAGLSKPLRDFVAGMLFGIQARQDVKLSNIARRLEEEIPLLKPEDRLSRNLQAEDLETHLRHRSTPRTHHGARHLGHRLRRRLAKASGAAARAGSTLCHALHQTARGARLAAPSLWWIAQIYLTRWKIEDTFRFIKQSFRLEDLRVRR